jgi:hypothetical protein
MSYDLSLTDAATGTTLEVADKHNIAGGTYVLGGSTLLELNVTYNYSKHYYKIMGEKGIRTLYSMTGKESLPVLANAIAALNDDVSSDYWEATEGNARKALIDLFSLACMAPDGVWQGD